MAKSKSVGLREAAAALSVSRTKLLRMVGDGLPVTRRSERVFVDVAAARQWIAEHETDGAQTAPVLHPDDPRYREKLFAARLDWLRAALDSGAVVRVEDAEARVADACTKLRAALLQLPSQFALGDGGDVGDALRAVLDEFDLTDWPKPRPVPPPPAQPAEATSDAPFAARYAAADPRHAYHVGRAASRGGIYEAGGVCCRIGGSYEVGPGEASCN